MSYPCLNDVDQSVEKARSALLIAFPSRRFFSAVCEILHVQFIDLVSLQRILPISLELDPLLSSCDKPCHHDCITVVRCTAYIKKNVEHRHC